MANRRPEDLLSSEVAVHMTKKHPNVPYRFDIGADIPLPINLAKRSKELHGKWNKGYPDVFVATCKGGYGGLYVELKATKEVPNTEHTRRQALYHQVLRQNGYYVTFACGIKEAKKHINKYVKGKYKK